MTMTTTRRAFVSELLIGALLSLAAASLALAGNPMRIKLATLAPKGSAYHRVLQQIGEAFRAAEGAGSIFTIYTDGTQGGEADVVRRMRIGQLNAAMMTAVGLSEIDPGISALQKTPLLFHTSDELEYVGRALRPELERTFRDKGFVIVLWAEAGWVRFFSKTPAKLPSDFKERRLFAWAGDAEQVELMKRIGYRPVVLETADIIPGLQTGLIDTVALTPMWALATQVDHLAPYMIDIKWAPIAGALVISRDTWDKMTPAARTAIEQAAARGAEELRSYQQRADTDAIAAMQKRGLHVQRLTPDEELVWQNFAQQVYPSIRGHMVPAETFDKSQRLVAEYRAKPKTP
jgi:TRAP-type C4-dicarboxylate transport system substrate-binding protein